MEIKQRTGFYRVFYLFLIFVILIGAGLAGCSRSGALSVGPSYPIDI